MRTLQHLEAVIKSRIPSILAMINKSIDEIEGELNQIGRPLANDAGVSILSESAMFGSISNYLCVIDIFS